MRCTGHQPEAHNLLSAERLGVGSVCGFLLHEYLSGQLNFNSHIPFQVAANPQCRILLLCYRGQRTD